MVSREIATSPPPAEWDAIERHGFTHLSLEETLLGGQSFVWEKNRDSGIWEGVIGQSVVRLRLADQTLLWQSVGPQRMTAEKIIRYFWLDESYERAIDHLPWRSDSVLATSMTNLPGLRILRQPLAETLFYFLLSPVKSIPQIKEIGKTVAECFGPDLGHGKHAFPGWSELSRVSEEKFREMRLGYRSKNMVGVAKYLGEHPDFLQDLSGLPYLRAKNEIMKLPGVGPKVADCVLLFGLGKTEAFPIDTWIEKTLEKRYRLLGWKADQKLRFAQAHFGRFAGLAQQFLFSGERLGFFQDRP